MGVNMHVLFELNICDLAELCSEGRLPDNWVFRVKNGRTIYNEIGGLWRPHSDKTIMLSYNDQKTRFCSTDLVMEVLENAKSNDG